MNAKEIKNQNVEGFENGLKFEDYKKGDIVGIFDRDRPIDEYEFRQDKVIRTIRDTNAQGKDVIRQVILKLDEKEGEFWVQGFGQIKNKLFRKVEQTEKKAPKVEANKNELDGDMVQVERAMGVKNPTVKEYLAKGYEFVGKEWNGERNMYIATLRKDNQEATA